MTDLPSSPEGAVPDWEAFLRQHESAGIAEIDLTTLKPGDQLLVMTEKTAYSLVMLEDGKAELKTNRGADRPSGCVVIHGCTFGASSTIKPNHLFCGGNLEFGRCEGGSVSTTTTIRALQVIRNDQPRAATG